MKFLSILLVCILFFSGVRAQLMIVPNHDNFFYLGIENHFQVAVNKYDIDKLILKADRGYLRKSDHGYSWQLCGEDISWVDLKCYLGKKLIDSLRYKVKRSPNPEIYVQPLDGDFSSSKQRPKSILIGLNFVNYTMPFKIKEYTIVIVRHTTDTIELKGNSSQFSQQILSENANLKIGDQYKIKNAIVFNSCEMKDRKLDETPFFAITEN